MQDTTLHSKRAHAFHTPLGNGTTPSPSKQVPVNPAAARPESNKQSATDTDSSTPASSFGESNAEAEIRRDYIFEEYAVIAPKRHKRPFDFRGNDHPLIETASSPHLNDQQVIDSLPSPLGGQPVRVVSNLYPAISLDNPKAYGKQELVVDTPLSNTPPGHLSLESMQDVLRIYQQRLKILTKLEHVRYVQIFKNDGHHAGASLAHAHTQIFALPIVPPKFQLRAQVVDAYVKQKGTNPYDDIIAFEQQQSERIISDTSAALVFTPYASGWPLEAWIIPKRHMQSLVEATPEEIKYIAESLLNMLRKLTDEGVNYNFFFEEGVSNNQRWVLKIYGRDVVSPLGGLEVSTGIMINTIPPEAAANWYKVTL